MQAGAEDVDAAAEVVSVASLWPKMVDRAGVGGCGAATDADATGLGGRLPWDQGTQDVFPLPRLTSPLPPCMTPPKSQQRRRRQIHHQWSECDDYSLNWLARYTEPSRQLALPWVVFERRWSLQGLTRDTLYFERC